MSLKAKDKYMSHNYNYCLLSAIYKLLQFGSAEFHYIGFKLNEKPYKLFTFTLRFNRILIGKNNFQSILPKSTLLISSSYVEKFIKNIIRSIFINQVIEISDAHNKCRFSVEQIEYLPGPQFREINYLKMLSPIVLSKVERREKGDQENFYS